MTKDVRTHDEWDNLPGSPQPYVLRSGQGERSVVVDQLATVLISGDETGGQFGLQVIEGKKSEVIPAHLHPDIHHTIWVLDGTVKVWADDLKGKKIATVLEKNDLLFIPAGTMHTYQIQSDYARLGGISTGGFERFVHAIGVPTGAQGLPVGPIPPVGEDYETGGKEFGIEFHPEWDPRTAEES